MESVRTLYRPAKPLDLDRTLWPLTRGPWDPVARRDRTGTWWRASRTPEGPSTTRFRRVAGGVALEAFGPGAEWAVAHAPELLGADDDAEDFRPEGKLGLLARRFAGLRITRTRAVYEALVRAISEQLVTGKEAALSHQKLAKRYGERAPGPVEMYLPPAPEVLAGLPYYDLRPLGIEMKRATALRNVARRAAKLEQTVELSREAAYARLEAVRGVGPWTSAEASVVALGDADAVSVGDYGLKHLVTYAFTGEPRGTDELMLELLEPYRPHRARVIRLLWASDIRAPRFGPRMPLRDTR
ncbi:MAG: DNA-3-methyladenine glycosylase 2 family protein [Deltaproteobacteria bacterium]|nr:DNA-3-methyladenine glycosylase 2 family protein [Deltaproteobacteria bacterium]